MNYAIQILKNELYRMEKLKEESEKRNTALEVDSYPEVMKPSTTEVMRKVDIVKTISSLEKAILILESTIT